MHTDLLFTGDGPDVRSEAIELDPMYLSTRYPNRCSMSTFPSALFGLQDALEAEKNATRVLDTLSEFIS
jgi:hypothetical protein